MAMDVYRRGSNRYVDVDVPGIDPDTIEVTVHGVLLRICARRLRRDFGHDDIELGERQHGLFCREMLVSESLDLTKMQTSCKRGVLTIAIPDR